MKETHILPLQAIQALLPLFRIDSVRSQDANYIVGGKKSVVICVPAADARVGVPYASAQAMSAAATVRGAEVMRRELAQLESQNVMRDVRVVIVDVGAVGKPGARRSRSPEEDVWMDTISDWTPSEQKIYGDAYAAYVSAFSQGHKRKPTSVNRFVRSLVHTVGRNAGKGCHRSTVFVGLHLWVLGIHRRFRGDRIFVGAGGKYILIYFSDDLDSLISFHSCDIHNCLILAFVPPRLTPQSTRHSGIAQKQVPARSAQRDCPSSAGSAYRGYRGSG